MELDKDKIEHWIAAERICLDFKYECNMLIFTITTIFAMVNHSNCHSYMKIIIETMQTKHKHFLSSKRNKIDLCMVDDHLLYAKIGTT